MINDYRTKSKEPKLKLKQIKLRNLTKKNNDQCHLVSYIGQLEKLMPGPHLLFPVVILASSHILTLSRYISFDSIMSSRYCLRDNSSKGASEALLFPIILLYLVSRSFLTCPLYYNFSLIFYHPLPWLLLQNLDSWPRLLILDFDSCLLAPAS